ncbi:anthranilate synthase component I, partial [Acidobacteria bacterium ACD]|nr:anthranilate synthase component I [Acidobacteria bacterium ACD]
MNRRLLTLERPADLTTPVAVMRNLLAGEGPCFLLESVERGERLARWSFLGAGPVGEISGRSGDPFALLKAVPEHVEAPSDADLPPFRGGAVGYLGYDAVRRLERLPSTRPDPLGLPDAWFGVFTDVVAFDHARHRLLFLTAAPEGTEAEARERLEGLAERALASRVPPAPRELRAGEFEETLPREAYCRAVEAGKEHVRAGDVFQVVLSRRWSAGLDGDAFAVYRALRRVSPSPYQYFLRTPFATIFGASPERLVAVTPSPSGSRVETVPLAGTRPRGATRAEDLAHERDLLADEKERAEHVMLVDLGRNDIGRVAEYGSVRVPQFMTLERYSHVMHLVSRVEGRLAEDRDRLDVLVSCFPAGTVSGAPKVRAMQIIAELERERRQLYAGAVGYLDFAGNLDCCIAIRTITMR